MPVSPRWASSLVDELAGGVRFRPHRQKEVRAIERAHENLGRADKQPVGDFGSGRGVRRGGHADRLDAMEGFCNLTQAQILRPEVVAPLRDAMRLVDGEKIDRDFAHCGDDVVAQQPFRRNIEKPERAVVQAARHPSPLVVVGGGIEARRLDPKFAQLGDLVAHQRDQRRDNEGQAAADDRRKLEAQRLAAACRHHRQHVFASERGGEDIFLPRTEVGKAKDGRQSGPRFRHERGVRSHGPRPPGSKTGVHCTDSTLSAPVASIMRRSKPSAAPLASGISASAARKSSSIGADVP